MIWLIWRQFRTQAAVALGTLAVIAVILIITGPHLLDLYRQGVHECRVSGGNNCNSPVIGQDPILRGLLLGLLLLGPILLGMFWGAPMVARELETGAYRLGWTQSASRTQWLAAKILIGATATAAAAGLLVWIVDWWSSPIEAAAPDHYTLAMFGILGITPIGYALFAFALGLTAGMIIRRTVPAMAVSVGIFTAVRLIVTYQVRPRLLPPEHLTAAASATSLSIGLSPAGISVTPIPPNLPTAWVYSSTLVDKSGHPPTAAYVDKACPALVKLASNPQLSPPGGGGGLFSSSKGAVHVQGGGPNAAFQSCTNALAGKFHEVTTYEPGSRYWPLQGLETALFVVLGAALLFVAFRWMRNRLV
ncbi:MAG TPA: hypothetical protein VGG38_20365 [Acidimicrobiales bacterium]|jgi:hypothetical protein